MSAISAACVDELTPFCAAAPQACRCLHQPRRLRSANIHFVRSIGIDRHVDGQWDALNTVRYFLANSNSKESTLDVIFGRLVEVFDKLLNIDATVAQLRAEWRRWRRHACLNAHLHKYTSE